MVSEKKSIQEQIYQHLDVIAQKTGVSAHLLLTGLIVCGVFVFIGYFDNYITNVVGILLPAYWSIKAIESEEADDDKQWLTYWVIFGMFSIIDLFSGFVLRFIPFYFFLKLAFLIFCMMPNTRGATLIYDHVLIKIFKKYETDLDKVTKNVQGTVAGAVDQGKKIIRDNQGKIITGGIEAAQKVIEAGKKE